MITEYTFATGLVIKAGEHIDYKRPVEKKLTKGKIVGFKPAPPPAEGMWMLVTEIENSKNRDFISCNVWKQMKDKGLFENQQQTKIETNASPEPPDSDLPF